ncbi:MAG: chemotaxis protein CheW [candidate division Zixibacteria bacterium]|nr:chemotaxis protein CheW [candidate division Zixibacteria bacterium]
MESKTTMMSGAVAEELLQLVSFKIGAEEFGVDITKAQEINRMVEITKAPQAPNYVEGVINLRGKVIPVVELRKRFGLPVAERNSETRIVNVEIGGQEIGMVVDAVTEVLRITSDSVEPPSSVITTADSGYLKGIAKLDDRLIIMLDLEQVLSTAEKEVLSGTDLAA